MELFSKKRKGIYVYFKHVRDIAKLEKYGNVITSSKKNRYIYFYVDESRVEFILDDLKDKKFVKKVVVSELSEIPLDFAKDTRDYGEFD